jgi:hypothetical protein
MQVLTINKWSKKMQQSIAIDLFSGCGAGTGAEKDRTPPPANSLPGTEMYYNS